MPFKFLSSGFGLIETIVSLGVIAVVTGVILSNFNNSVLWNEARIQRRKLDINIIADAYIAKALNSNSYLPLTEADFYNHKIPIPPEGGSYQGLLKNSSSFFKVCTPLSNKDDAINCIENGDNAKCYCRASQNAEQSLAKGKPPIQTEPKQLQKTCSVLNPLPSPKISIYDSFNRGDSTTSLSKTETGQPWLNIHGIWGVSSNTAYPDTIIGSVKNPTDTYAVVDTGHSDGIIEVSLASNVQDARIAFRVIDQDNNYFVERNVLGYHVEKTVQGLRFELTPKVINSSFLDGDRVKVELRGQCIFVSVNNNLILQTQDSTHTTTKHGLGTYSNKNVRFDNFSYRYP